MDCREEGNALPPALRIEMRVAGGTKTDLTGDILSKWRTRGRSVGERSGRAMVRGRKYPTLEDVYITRVRSLVGGLTGSRLLAYCRDHSDASI